MHPSETNTWTYARSEAEDFPARSVPVFPLRGLGGLVRWLCRAPVRRLAAARATEQELVYE